MLVDDNGLARGVQYFDRKTGAERQVLGKVVVMGASCVDTTRILLNSTSARHPNGIGNGSDVIGRYLCEQIRLNARGFMPSLYGKAASDDKGIGGEHMLHAALQPPRRPQARLPARLRHAVLGHAARDRTVPATTRRASTASARRSRTRSRKRYPAWVELHPFGEVLPYADNRITVDKTKTDRYGVPLLHIDYRIGENERKMMEHMADTIEEIAQGVRRRARRTTGAAQLDRNGSAIHEHGTCRMGDDPKRSALNTFNQMHEVKNVFVVDGSSFTTASEKNPTHHDPLARLARDGLSRGGDEARKPVASTSLRFMPVGRVPRTRRRAARGAAPTLMTSQPTLRGVMQIQLSPRVYPVIVVGSGASGGMAAWNLTRQGVDVLLLDAGERFDRSTFWTHVTPWEARARRARGEQPPALPAGHEGAALPHRRRVATSS